MIARPLGLVLWLTIFAFGVGFAAEPELSGTWQGHLQVDPKTTMTVQFVFSKAADGSYSGVLNSPDNPAVKNVPTSGVSWQGGALKLAVPPLSGAYAGTLKDGRIEGTWTQEGSSLPLVLTVYQKPQLTKAAIDTLTGTWKGPLQVPGGTFTFVVRFKPDAKGAEMQGTLAVAEQGGQEVPFSEVEFADGKLDAKIARVNGELNATYANGALVGTWKQAGPGAPPAGIPVTLKKGEYVPPVYALKLSNANFVALSGDWQGTLSLTTPQGQAVSLPLVLRFGTNDQAQYVGFVDSPKQGAKGLPITDVSVTGSKVVMKFAIGAEYDADLAGNTLTGHWIQGPLNNPVTFTRK